MSQLESRDCCPAGTTTLIDFSLQTSSIKSIQCVTVGRSRRQLIKQHGRHFKSQHKRRRAVYPSVRFVFRGSGGSLRHVGVAVGSVEGAEGRRGPVGRFGERDIVRVCVAPEHKAAEGVAVGQDDHRLHQLRQRPALLAQQRLERHGEEVSVRLRRGRQP